MRKQIMAITLCLCMVVTLLPTIAFAVDEEVVAIQLGSGSIAKDSTVYFGTYEETDVPWIALDSNGFLLSEYTIGASSFRESRDWGYYNYSTVSCGVDSSNLKYAMDGLYNGESTALFTTLEQGAIEETTLDGNSMSNGMEDVSAYLFPLSREDAEAITEDSGIRNAKSITDPEGDDEWWWLRSSNGSDMAYYTDALSGIDSCGTENVFGVRPAFNLNLNSVLFTSAASGGKSAIGMNSGLTAASVTTQTEWKLTLLDADRDFAAATTAVNGDVLTVLYSGAATGTNEYISAIIKTDSGNVTHYGRLKNTTAASDASGTADVDISGIDMTGKTLYVFSEQYNGDKKTDYASELLEVSTHSHSWAEDWTTDDTYHWHECENEDCLITQTVDKNGYGEHTYDNDEDVICNDCDYERPHYILNVSVEGVGGSVTPVGDVNVLQYHDKTITILPDAFYEVDEVLLDGTPISLTGNSHTVEDFTEDHDVSVSFKPVTPSDEYHTVTINAPAHGVVSPSGEMSIPHGHPIIVYLYPDSGYELDRLFVNEVEMNVIGNRFILSAVTEDCGIDVSFRVGQTPQIEKETIHSSAGPNGTVFPSGSYEIESGGDTYYYFLPDDGYVVYDVTVDDIRQEEPGDFYHFSDVTEEHRIHVTFKSKNQVDIEKVKAAIEGRDWTVSQTSAGTEDALKSWIESQLAGMNLNGVNCAVNITAFTAAVTGTASDYDGTNGSFNFTVSLSKGQSNDSADKSGTITANRTYYSGSVVNYFTLTFDTNGGSSISSIRQSEDTTVDLTKYTPVKDGYTFTGWYSDKELTAKITSVSLTKNTTVYSGWNSTDHDIGAWVNPFTDISENDWFYEDVALVNLLKLMNGTSSTTFSPYAAATRGMIVTILYRMENESAPSGNCPFDDVKSDSYYEKAITWAAANGIAKGYGNGKFGPDDFITREQMATILYRYEQYKGGGFTGAWMFLLDSRDADKVSEWAYEAMCWYTMKGIIVGNDDGTLAPRSNAQRCHTADIVGSLNTADA